MNICVYRHPGKPATCGEDKQACGRLRLIRCVACDVVRAAWGCFMGMFGFGRGE